MNRGLGVRQNQGAEGRDEGVELRLESLLVQKFDSEPKDAGLAERSEKFFHSRRFELSDGNLRRNCIQKPVQVAEVVGVFGRQVDWALVGSHLLLSSLAHKVHGRGRLILATPLAMMT